MAKCVQGYCGPGPSSNTSLARSHLVLIRVLWGACFYHPYITEEREGTPERLSHWPRVIVLANGRVLESKFFLLQSQHFFTLWQVQVTGCLFKLRSLREGHSKQIPWCHFCPEISTVWERHLAMLSWSGVARMPGTPPCSDSNQEPGRSYCEITFSVAALKDAALHAGTHCFVSPIACACSLRSLRFLRGSALDIFEVVGIKASAIISLIGHWMPISYSPAPSPHLLDRSHFRGLDVESDTRTTTLMFHRASRTIQILLVSALLFVRNWHLVEAKWFC